MDNLSQNLDSSAKDKLQPHCFPEINLKDSEHTQKEGKESGQFKHNYSGQRGENSIDQSQPWPRAAFQNEEIDVEALIADAREQGYAAGFNDGRIEERKTIEQVAGAVSKAISDMEIYKKELLLKAEEGVVKFGLAVAGKIIAVEPTIAPEIIISIVKNALKMVVDPTNVKIKINPKDIDLLTENDAALKSVVGKNATVQFEADASISSGGCLVETDFGDIDARLEAQLQIIEKAALQELSSRKQQFQGDM